MSKAAPRSKQQVVADFRRTEILNAAVAVFGRKGFAESRMDDVASQAKLAKGTLYLYFRSKDEVYDAAIQQAVAELRKSTETRVREAVGLRARIAAFIKARVLFWEEHKDLYQIILSMGRNAVSGARNYALQKDTVAYLSQLFDEAIKRKEIPRQNREAAAWAVVDIVRGATERRVFSGEPLSNSDIQSLVDFIMAAVENLPSRSRRSLSNQRRAVVENE